VKGISTALGAVDEMENGSASSFERGPGLEGVREIEKRIFYQSRGLDGERGHQNVVDRG